MYHDWGYKLQYDFASTGSNGKGIKDAYLTYNGFDDWQLKAGNFKVPFSLEQQISSKHTLFTERSLLSALSSGRRIGAMASIKQKHWSLTGGVFGDKVDKKGNADNEDWGLAMRATFAPINEKTHVVHLGLGLNHRDVDNARFRERAETHVTDVRIVDTRSLNNIDNIFKTGLELATVMGLFHHKLNISMRQ